MKGKVKVGIILTLIISTILSLMVSVNAATITTQGKLDTINMQIKQTKERWQYGQKSR